MGFDEDRILNHPLCGHEGSVESFQVTHLKDELFRFGQSDQFISLLKSFGDGFF